MCRTKYDPELTPQLAKQYCREGCDDNEIARRLDIDGSTFYRWKNRHREFCESLKHPKTFVDSQVEDSLFKRARGYEYEETKTVQKLNAQGVLVIVSVETTKKVLPPDPTSMIFWLKNRQRDKWRDVQEHGASEEALERLDALLGRIGDEAVNAADAETADGVEGS